MSDWLLRVFDSSVVTVGLGLALSRRLARGMGGELKCRLPAKGVCFVLSLRAAALDARNGS